MAGSDYADHKPGVLADVPFHLAELFVVEIDEVEVQFNAFLITTFEEDNDDAVF